MNYIRQYLELIASFPFVIQVSMWFIFVNAIAILVFMFIALFIRRNKRLDDELDQDLQPKNVAFLNRVFNEAEELTTTQVFDQYISEVDNVSKKGKIRKAVFPSLINAFEDIISKDSRVLENKNYRVAIAGLRVDEFLFKKLQFTSVGSRLRIFQTFSILGLTAPDASILPFTHSRNIRLRKESRSSYVAISNNDPFKFFDQADNSLNQWDTISMIQQLEIHHKDNLPNFSRWIKYSQNNKQLIFVIKAVSYFNQTTSAPVLVELLNHEDHQIRKEAINSLGSMKILEAEQAMITMYPNQPQDCQDAIVEAVFNIRSGNSLGFLQDAYTNASNLESKKLVAEAIYGYNVSGEHFVQGQLQQKEGFERLILEHIKNPLIPKQLRSKRTMKQMRINSALNFSSI